MNTNVFFTQLDKTFFIFKVVAKSDNEPVIIDDDPSLFPRTSIRDCIVDVYLNSKPLHNPRIIYESDLKLSTHYVSELIANEYSVLLVLGDNLYILIQNQITRFELEPGDLFRSFYMHRNDIFPCILGESNMYQPTEYIPLNMAQEIINAVNEQTGDEYTISDAIYLSTDYSHNKHRDMSYAKTLHVYYDDFDDEQGSVQKLYDILEQHDEISVPTIMRSIAEDNVNPSTYPESCRKEITKLLGLKNRTSQ